MGSTVLACCSTRLTVASWCYSSLLCVGDQQGRQTGGRGNDRSASELVVSCASEGVNTNDDSDKTSHSIGATERTWADVVKFSSSQQSTN